MISSLSGTVQHIGPESVVIEVGGVGLAVQCGGQVIRDVLVGQHAMLSTSLVVREDSLTLYGFVDSDHRDVFEILQSVSGVGPRLALGVLSVLSPDQLRTAVARSDEATLTRVPGIGRKGAQRMVLELADKLGAPRSSAVFDLTAGRGSGTAAGASWQAPVREALVSLGWSGRDADEAIAVVESNGAQSNAAGANDAGPEHPETAEERDRQVSKMLALALRGLGRR